MAAPTYTLRALVLRKTKLGESDLILTFLAEDGSQLRAVAKGARKPTSSFAARLELYSLVDVMCAKGRNLDIVKEARLVASNERLRLDMEHAAAAAPMAELLDKATQVGLENPRLFALTASAFSHLVVCAPEQAPLFTAAHLLKTLAVCGFRPGLDACVACGDSAFFQRIASRDGSSDCVGASASGVSFSPNADGVFFSHEEGGIVCSSCRRFVEAVPMPVEVVQWMRYLLLSTFDEIAKAPANVSAAFAVLEVLHQWIRIHVGSSMKSMNFLFTCGLYQ